MEADMVEGREAGRGEVECRGEVPTRLVTKITSSYDIRRFRRRADLP